MNKLTPLTEAQFHTVWTTAVGMSGYDKALFREALLKLKNEGLIIPEHSKELRLNPGSEFFTKDNTVEEEIYMILEEVDIETVGEARRYLNTMNPNLTVCPKCHVDDFVHVESCEFYKRWNKE